MSCERLTADTGRDGDAAPDRGEAESTRSPPDVLRCERNR